MKFVCERCQTKYSIADDKVRQKILKIRCKTCENVITIRDAVVVSEAGAGKSEGAPPMSVSMVGASVSTSRNVEWHLAVNGSQEGPFGLSALVNRIQKAGRADELYVWNEHLDGWKEPKAVPEVAAEMRARAAVTAPPMPAGARRAPTPAIGRGTLPPGISGVRPTGSVPVTSSRPSASMPAVRAEPVPSPSAGAAMASFDEGNEECTQISTMGAGMMMPEPVPEEQFGPSHSVAFPFAALKEKNAKDKNANGSAKPHPGASGLEGLDFVPVPAAASKWPAPAVAAAAALPTPLAAPLPSAVPVSSGVVAAPVVGGSTSMLLSQVGGRAARVRHPAVKYVVTGGVLVGLIVLVSVLTMTGGDKSAAPDKATAPTATAPAPKGDPEAEARAEAEKYFKNMVGESNPSQPANTTKTVAPPPRRVAASSRKNNEPTPAPAVAPPPVSGAAAPDGVGVTKRFAQDERRVSVPRSGGGHAGGEVDQDKLGAVFKQQDHYSAIKSCYQRALKRDEKLKVGRLDINVTVGETGSVRKVHVQAPSEFSSVSTCIQDAVRRWRFPATSSEYEASFPLILTGSSG